MFGTAPGPRAAGAARCGPVPCAAAAATAESCRLEGGGRRSGPGSLLMTAMAKGAAAGGKGAGWGAAAGRRNCGPAGPDEISSAA